MRLNPAPFLAAALLCLPGLALAQEMPGRGEAMSRVEARLGAPIEKHAAVGQPPITRWDYPGFSVYFEYDHVIHAVAERGLAVAPRLNQN